MKNTKRKRIIRASVVLLVATLTFITLKANIIGNILMVKKVSSSDLLPQSADSTTIPFFLDQGRISVTVAIQAGDAPATEEQLIFDTGALSMFTNKFADSKHLKKEAVDIKTVAYGGKEYEQKNYITAQPVTFSIGGMKLQQGHVNIGAIAGNDFSCKGAVGLLGSNLLSHFTVKIDFKKQTITLYKKDVYNYSQLSSEDKTISFMPLPFQKNPYIGITVGGKDFSGVLDTGDPGLLMLQYKKTVDGYNAARLKDTTQTITYKTYANISNVQGVVKEKGTSYVLKNVSVTIDEDSIALPAVSILDNQTKDNMSIGLKFLSRYDQVLIDWHKKNIRLIGAPTDQLLEKPQLAIRYLEDEKRFVIGAIDIHSQFYANGLRSGDEVVTLGGQSLQAIVDTHPCDYATLLRQQCLQAHTVQVSKAGTLTNING